MKASNVALGILAGVAVGALVGILFAPDKGTNTRKKISKKSKEYADDLKGQVNHLVDVVSSPFHSEKEDTNGMTGSTKRKLVEVKR